MTNFLQVECLTKSFGDRILFSDISLGINEGDKIGLIAKNGSGKTTLLRIITGSEDYDEGKIVHRNGLRVGYLEQVPEFHTAKSVIDTCLEGDDEISNALRRYEYASVAEDATELARAIVDMDNQKAWDYEARFKQILSMLKINDIYQPISQLSGGQVKRVALAKILISEPQLLVLDEPTNHLDIEMIEWLEDYLSRQRVALLMVTHDRYFLDAVCNRIVEIDDHQLYSYDGNYNYYLEKRAERIDAQSAEIAKAKNLLRTELDWMRRQPQARAGKAKYRIDAFYDLKDKASVRMDSREVNLNVKSSYIGSKIFVAHDVCKRFDDKVIIKDFSYVFSRYEKLGIVGNNGAGKSTFIKLLLGEYVPDSGYFEIGETVRFGYYSQEGIRFDESKRVIDAIRDIAEHVTFDEKTSYSASQFLSQFLFSPKDQQKLIAKLSGGERRRLYLATVLMHKPNFLILDEPTNDLDISTLEVLEDYLAHFSGCVIIISHDRFFMDRTVDHILVFEGEGKIADFPGNYSCYRQWKRQQAPANTGQKPTETTQKIKDTVRKSNRLSFKEKKELEALTAELEAMEQEKRQLEALFNSGSVITDMAEKSKRYNEISELMDEKEMRWLELSEKEQ